MKIKLLIINAIFISLASLFVSCSQGPYKGFELVGEQVYIKYHQKGDVESGSPKVDDFVTVSMEYRVKNKITSQDTTLFSTREYPEPITFPLIEPTFKGDIYAGLSFLVAGDSVTLAFPADSFYVKTAGIPEMPEFIEPGTTMYFDMKLISFKTAEEVETENRVKLQQAKEEEIRLLAEYIGANNINVAPLESGLYFIEQKMGTGRLPKEGDMLQLHFNVGLVNGMQLFSSFEQDPIDVEFGKTFDTKGFDEALAYLRKGSKAQIIVPSSLAFDSVGRSQMIPPYTTLVYEIELLNIRDISQVQAERAAKARVEELAKEQAQFSEAAKIGKYIKDNNIQKEPSPTGLFYIETEAGTGAQAVEGKKVKVHYTLYNIEGRKLQSSKDMDRPFEFVLGRGEVIQGWEEGVAMMKAGGKARLIVPSALAYGASQRGEDIPPYSPLVFEVELLEVN
jgi:FKBP-type peptidyl-prolyl cis-trans isomerase